MILETLTPRPFHDCLYILVGAVIIWIAWRILHILNYNRRKTRNLVEAQIIVDGVLLRVATHLTNVQITVNDGHRINLSDLSPGEHVLPKAQLFESMHETTQIHELRLTGSNGGAVVHEEFFWVTQRQ